MLLRARRARGSTDEDPTGRFWRWRRWLFAAGLILLGIIAGGLYMFSHLKLPAPKPLKQTTLIYDASGTKVIASFSQQNRINVTLKQVPPVVINAIVSTEDRHFFTEGALNPVSIGRAFISDVTGGHLQGASTITQQYVKQAYLSPKRTLTRKVEEAMLAIRLSRSESKQQILQNYLNTIYWGRGAYGVEAASMAYFGKPVQQLGLPEASLLAGLIREPESADPARNQSQARQNQDDTLKAMVRDHKITVQQANAVKATPFSSYVIAPTASTGSTAHATSTSTVDPSGEAYFISAVRQELYNKYGRALVDGGGLRVTTTLDPAMQQQAYDSIYGHASPLNPARGTPSGALVSVDDTGAVKALVGGQDYGKSTVNLALGSEGGGSGRQAGSTFKAFMLAEVLKEGYSANSVFPAPRQYVVPHGNANGAPWIVTNFEGEVPAPTLSLVDATVHSVNTVYAQVVMKIGADKLNSMAEALGISPKELVGAYPSRVLGTADVSPLEMAAAYATFANGGVYHRPLLITKVTDASGKSLPLPVQPQSRVVLTPGEDAQLSSVLQQVVLRGTAVAAGHLPFPVAGKTGTTENSADAWFIGYTPNLTTAVWMGYASGNKPMGYVQGGTVPAEMWHTYMEAVLTAMPQYGAPFPPAVLTGKILTPPSASSLLTPGDTVPSTPSSTPGPQTTQPVIAPPDTTPTTSPPPPSTSPPPPSTSPPTTSPPTTKPTTSTTAPSGN